MEKSQEISNQTIDDEIDLIELFNKYIRPFWKTYLKSALLFAFLFTVVSFRVTPQYKASVALMVNTGESSSSSSRLGGLASLAGFKMRANGSSDVLFNINYLQSREVAEAFIKKAGLRKKLFYKALNAEGEFTEKKSLFSFLSSSKSKKNLVDDEDVLNGIGPSKWSTYKRFKSVFLIDINEKDMTANVSVRWEDPLLAKRWANDYVAFINQILKEKAIHESNLKIQYLESQIGQNSSIEVQQSIYSLVEDELKKIAVAESSDQYAFKIVERAFLPERKVSPKRKRYLVAGGFFGLFIVFARVFYRENLLRIFDKRKAS